MSLLVGSFQIPGPAEFQRERQALGSKYEVDPKKDGHPIPRSENVPALHLTSLVSGSFQVSPGRIRPWQNPQLLPPPLSSRTPLDWPMQVNTCPLASLSASESWLPGGYKDQFGQAGTFPFIYNIPNFSIPNQDISQITLGLLQGVRSNLDAKIL